VAGASVSKRRRSYGAPLEAPRGALGARLRAEPPRGGAALLWPSELGRRRRLAAAHTGKHGGDATEGEGDDREVLEDRKLTVERMEAFARAEEACIAGIRPVAGGR
jgi:hypothetical protein